MPFVQGTPSYLGFRSLTVLLFGSRAQGCLEDLKELHQVYQCSKAAGCRFVLEMQLLYKSKVLVAYSFHIEHLSGYRKTVHKQD